MRRTDEEPKRNQTCVNLLTGGLLDFLIATGSRNFRFALFYSDSMARDKLTKAAESLLPVIEEPVDANA